MRRVVLGTIVLLFVLPVSAVTVEVHVRDEYDAVVPGVPIGLDLRSRDRRFDASDFRLPLTKMETGKAGTALFRDVPPGQYQVVIGRKPEFVHPDDNPYAPAPLVTVTGDRLPQRIDVEVWKGSRILGQLAPREGNTATGRVRFHEPCLDKTVTLPVRDSREQEWRLVPGLWEATLLPVEGYLPIGTEVDGYPVRGKTVRLEPVRDQRPVFVTWYLTAPCRIHGTVMRADPMLRPAPGGTIVVARLEEPGPWLEAFLKKHHLEFEHDAIARVERDGSFDLSLPDGRWTVGVAGPGVSVASPREVQVELKHSESMVQDFIVAPRGGRSPDVLQIYVQTPDGVPPNGATVELRLQDRSASSSVRRMRAHPSSSVVVFSGLEPGIYVGVAGHAEYREGTGSVPYAGGLARRSLNLNTAGVLHAKTVDSEGQPLAGVQLRLERLDDPPEHSISDPLLVNRIHFVAGVSDSTGHAWVRGIWPGRYLLSGRLTESRIPGGVVRFPRVGKLHDSIEIEFHGSEQIQQQVKVLPVAGLTGRLACEDGQPVPGRFSVRAVAGQIDFETASATVIAKATMLRLDDVHLRGGTWDVFAASPLDRGSYFVAFRAGCHDRWTWYRRTERRNRAGRARTQPGGMTDLGTVFLDCGPTIRIRALIDPDAMGPTLDEVIAEAGGLRIDGTVTDDAGATRRVRWAVVDVWEDQIVLRRLPEGKARLELSLRHGQFLPGPESRLIVEANLERGKTARSFWPFPEFGGAVEIRGVSAGRATLSAENGRILEAEAFEGSVLIESVPPGSYDLQLRGGGDGPAVVRTWNEIEIEPFSTLLFEGGPSNSLSGTE